VRTSDFDYELPPEYIAQHPAVPRDSSRLMVLDRSKDMLAHHRFSDLPSLLKPGDALVVNRTRVIPARLRARKRPGGGRAELLLLRRMDDGTWEVIVGGKGLNPGRKLDLENGPSVSILEDLGGTQRLVQFDSPIEPLLDRIGEMPLPPYIRAPLRKPGDYQTVFAREPGSAAAPTAGLHFTHALIERLEEAGIEWIELTLHVGLDTFAPVTEADPDAHTIHSEWCRLDERAAARLNRVRDRGGRIVAVGTTSTRTLESAARSAPPGQTLAPFEGSTDLFILPGFEFHAVDALITNFHLPRSTLLMLVSAFAGRKRILRAYEAAKDAGYRFYSFGDAMLLL
jgi:S-adenosylmethionine:tRNA ribosyltransferase-isomerase